MFLRDQGEHEVIIAAILLPKFRMTWSTEVSILIAAKYTTFELINICQFKCGSESF